MTSLSEPAQTTTAAEPHYELWTVPDPGWPRLYAVTADGERMELNRQLWGSTICEGIRYAKAGGFTRESGRVVDGVISFYPGKAVQS